jgi:hypothetical protein
MKAIKKLQRVLRLLPLLLLASPALLQAQFTFTTNADNTITIARYTGPGGDVTIPEMTNGHPVVSIGTNAFYESWYLTSIAIPSSVTSIGDYAFYWCTELSSLTLLDSVTSIGELTFCGCSGLTNVTLGNGVTSIGSSAFNNCPRLTNLTIPSSVTNIGSAAFDGTGLISVTLPNSVTTIADDLFSSCYSLTSVTIPNSVTSIGFGAFYGCYSLASVKIPSSVTAIGDYAFGYCTSLAGVYFQGDAPQSVDPSVFWYGNDPTVYYLPGTTGWDNWIAPPAAVLWNPTPQSPAVHANQFGFTITGTANIPIAVEACTNLSKASWTALQSCTLTNGSIYFSDPNWGNYPARAYRIRLP